MKRISIIFCVAMLMLILTACGGAVTTKSAAEYIGTNYETVMSELTEAGFENITIKEVEDLTSTSTLQDCDVGEVTIDGNSSFEEKAKFEKDVPVMITYHTIKKAMVPLSSDNLQSHDYIEIAAMFTDAGFSVVTSEEVYDLDPLLTDAEFTNEVIIDYVSLFTEGEEFAFDVPVKVICHKQFERYDVKLHINFISNLLFNKYDVDITVDGQTSTLAHGEDADYNFSLKEGEYTLAFESAESVGVNGQATLMVNCDMEASYEISCYGDEIRVTEEYVDRKETLAEDEVKVLSDESEFTYGNYKDAVQKLRELGFTNIKEEPLYDIRFGITAEGSVDNVTINGSDTYKRGDVFKKDAEVVVSYHMKEEDNPDKPVESKPEEIVEPELPTLTIANCPELKEMLSNKAEIDPSYTDFAFKYSGRVIAFNGNVAYLTNHEDYNTRWDLLLTAGDYDPNHQVGPVFKFENVMFSDLNSDMDSISAGQNVYIRAEVVSFNSSNGLFYLKPVKVTSR